MRDFNHGVLDLTMLANFQMQYNNTNFMSTSNTPSNFPPMSPGGGSNISLSNSLPLQTSCGVGNSTSASATNQSIPPAPTSADQIATTSPIRKTSKKVMIPFFAITCLKGWHFCAKSILTLTTNM